MHTQGFMQILVFMLDDKTNKIFPALFRLINSINKEGYNELMKSIYNILTIENTIELKLTSITIDLEKA